MEDKFSAHNRRGVDIESAPTHSIIEDYPPVAFQQLLYNAVMHRTYEGTNAPIRVYWYDDRVEINSPGGPYGAVTERNFGQPGVTDYRNPNVAEALKIYGFAQRFGRGIEVARRALADNGNPPPIFDVAANSVTCRLYSMTS
jgi:ATP-dependent DNA helicase RecG